MRTPLEELHLRGDVGGRTVQIIESGEVECLRYDPPPLPEGSVRVRTQESVISPGTESTFLGRDASNVHLHRSWNPDLRIFQAGTPTHNYPVTFGDRAAGMVVESPDPRVELGARVWGAWCHTEFVSMPAEQALTQSLPVDITWDDGVDIGQMAPICINAALFGEGEQEGAPAVVYGAGPIGLLTAQAVRASRATPVYVVDRLTYRLEIAANLGFTAIDVTAGDVAATVKAEHGVDGVPVAWECTGSPQALHDATRVVARRGLVVAVGFYQGDSAGLRLGEEFHHNGIRIVSSQIGNPHPSTDRPGLQMMALAMITADSISPSALPRLRIPIEQVEAAYEAVRRPHEILQVSLTYGD